MEFHFEANGVDPEQPLIYRWEIFDHVGERTACYVGKSKNGAKRPLRDYKRNVRRLLQRIAVRLDEVHHLVMKAYSVDLREKIVAAVRRGMSKAQVALTFGVGDTS